MVLEQCCESWRTAKQTQSASIDASNSATAMPNPNFPSSNHRAQFIPARDSRNRRIPGLYIRGGRFYAQLWIDLGNGKKAARRFPLRNGDNQPVRTLSAAREALEIKRHERRENQLPAIGYKP